MSQVIFFGTGGTPPPGTVILTLTGDTGGAVGPDGIGNIDLIGGPSVTVDGNPGANTLTINLDGSIANQYTTDAGIAIPVLGNLNVLGGANMNTAGATDTVTINLNDAIFLPATNGTGTAGVVAIDTTRLHAFNDNLFLGITAGNFTTTGISNTGIGGDSLGSITTGSSNTSLGDNSLASLTSGIQNTAVGAGAGVLLETANNNVAIGFRALGDLQTGNRNTAIGISALDALNGGEFNTAVGETAGEFLTAGNYNILLGSSAGTNYAGIESSNIIISNPGLLGEDNTIRIGDQGTGNGQQDACFIAGIYQAAIGATNEVVFIDDNGKLGSSAGTDGQVIIGATGASPQWASLTAGANITITPGANSITIASTGGTGFTWNEVTGTTQAMAVNNGYIANNVALVTLTLPANANVGDVIRVSIKGTGLASIAQNAGQTIHFGNQSTTTGATGSLDATAQYDAVELLCITQDTDFSVLSSVGNWNIV